MIGLCVVHVLETPKCMHCSGMYCSMISTLYMQFFVNNEFLCLTLNFLLQVTRIVHSFIYCWDFWENARDTAYNLFLFGRCQCRKSAQTLDKSQKKSRKFRHCKYAYGTLVVIIGFTWNLRCPFGIFEEPPKFCLTKINKSRRNSAAQSDSSCKFRTPLPLGFEGQNQVQKSSSNLLALRALAASWTWAAVAFGGSDLIKGKCAKAGMTSRIPIAQKIMNFFNSLRLHVTCMYLIWIFYPGLLWC